MNITQKELAEWKSKRLRLKEDQKEFEKCERDPLYFYNEYVRFPDEKFLNQKELDSLHKRWKEERKNYLHKENLLQILPSEAFFKINLEL